MELRPYQQEAEKAVFAEWEKGNKRTLLVLPTGTGKTIVFAKITERCVKNGERVLILAHRAELLEQAVDKIKKVTGLRCAVEKAEESCIGSWYRIVVGSVQTMMRQKRLNQFDTDYFDTIIIDEAHHCISDSYQKVIDYFSESKLLGVTATPDRGDMKNLGKVFESMAYEYSLSSAIKEGFLSPIKAQTIPLKLDLTEVGTQAGDFKTSDLGTALEPYLYQIADEMKKYCDGRKTVVFLPLVKTSQKFCNILNENGFKAAEINGNSDNRSEILNDFNSGKYNVICNSMLLTKRKLVDPIQFEMSIQAEDLSGYVPAFGWEMSPPTDKQKNALEKLGIMPDEIENSGKAAKILDRLEKRKNEGLTTPKQIRCLEQKGFKHVGTWQFEAASKLIARISANGWRVPNGINPATFNPELGA